MIKNIEFNNSRQEKIKGVLKEKNTSGLLLITCQGYKVSKDHPAIGSITNTLYKKGHSTFSFNFSGSAQGFNLIQQISDIKDIINFFKDYKEIIILAGSYGSLSGLIAATKLPKIKGAVTVNGFFGSSRIGLNVIGIYIFFRVLSLFKGQYKKIWDFFKKNYKPEKMNLDVLIIHVRHDKEVYISQSEDFFKRVSGRKEFYILEEGDHHLTREAYKEETARAIDSWLKNRF